MNNLNKERRRWKRWEESLNKYKKLVEEIGKDGKKFDELKEKLDKQFGVPCLFYGPFTIITDLNILVNPDIILPGDTEPFAICREWSFLKLKEALGKIVESEPPGYKGRVIGYAYDAGDDYFVIRTESGEIKYVILNSHFTIIDKKEEET